MFGPKTWLRTAELAMREHPFLGLLVACLTSAAVHGVAYASLGSARRTFVERPPSRMTVRVSPPEKVKVPEPPEPEPPPTPEPPKPAPRKRALEASPPEPAAPLPQAAPLPGVTLTNESGTGSFDSVIGDGSSFQGPLAPVGRPAEPKPVAPKLAATAPKPALPVPVVPIADLSEKPRPPDLASALREHYPADARRRGVSGSATVKARIDPDGRIRSVSVVNETFAGFGQACRGTLVGSRWSPPRDREGRAVSTAIRYTCRFVVQP
jgi:TonB family protein